MPAKIEKNGQAIRSIEEWFQYAPPRGGARHWRPGRSAMELARAWVGSLGEPALPPELAILLTQLAPAETLRDCVAYAERQVAIDGLRGEPPNIDLAIAFPDNDQPQLAACIEAKADEPFGDEVFVKLAQAASQLARDERTFAVTRIQDLAFRLLATWRPGLTHLGELRYQLLTGIAGTLAFAQSIHAKIAVFVIHEFVDVNETKEANLASNADDLNRFVRRVSGIQERVIRPGDLIGPIPLPRIDQSLYIGKIRRDLLRRPQ